MMKGYFIEENGKEYFIPPLPASIEVKSKFNWSQDYLEFRLACLTMMSNALSNIVKYASELNEMGKKEDKEKAEEIREKIAEFCQRLPV